MSTNRVSPGNPSGGQFSGTPRVPAALDPAAMEMGAGYGDDVYPALTIQADTASALPTRGDSKFTFDDVAGPDGIRRANFMRARTAGDAVRAYAKVSGLNNEEPVEAITDCIGDIHHLCDALGLDFEEILRKADVHHAAEIRGIT